MAVNRHEMVELFGGLRPTHQAVTLVQKARLVGVPEPFISSTVSHAVAVAREGGRNKVGPFGEAKDIFRGLKQAIITSRR